MKRFFCLSLCFILCLTLLGCSKSQNVASADEVSSIIASEIENIDGVENFDKETIKTLARLYRSNYSKNKNLFNLKNRHKSDYIYNIVNSENISSEEVFDKIVIFDNKNNWSKDIEKVDILKFLSKKEVSIVSISDAEPVFENEIIVGVKIGKHTINIDEIVLEFDLPSKYISNIEDHKTKITVLGKLEENAVSLDPKTIDKMAKEGKKRDEILKSLNNDFYLITKNK